MMDRILSGVLWLTVVSMITASLGSALVSTYRGLVNLCAKSYEEATVSLGAAIACSIAGYFLCRNGNNLMDR